MIGFIHYSLEVGPGYNKAPAGQSNTYALHSLNPPPFFFPNELRIHENAQYIFEKFAYELNDGGLM